MNYKINGKEIPEIVIGTWGWGKGLNGCNMIFGRTPEKEELKKVFDILYGAGYRMWDSSPVFGWGSSERLLGEVSAFWDKESLIMSTKFSPGDNFRVFEISGMLSGSVKRLGVKKPDLYMIEKPKFFEKTLEAFAVLHKEKAVGDIGVCNCSLANLEKAKAELRLHGYRIKAVQNHYSLLHRRDEKNGVMDWCRKNGVPFFAYMTLEHGALGGRYSAGKPLPLLSARGLAFGPLKMRKAQGLIAELVKIGESYGISPAAVAILWVKGKGAVPVVGVTRAEQALELAKIKGMSLSREEMSRLDAVSDKTNINTKASWEKD